MGIIGRQGFKKTVISYIGVLIGLIATLYVYPLEEAMYGLARFLMSIATLLSPIMTLGVHSLVVRFFPYFRDNETGHHGFLGFLLMVSSISYFVFGVLLLIWRDEFYDLLRAIDMNVEVFSENLLETGILVFFLSLSMIFTGYISNFKRIVIPGIFNSLILKIGLPVLILLVYFQLFQEPHFKWGLILIHAVILISLVLYTYHLGELHLKPDFTFITRKLASRMGGYSLHGIIASLGATIAFKIDAIMTASMLGFASTGIYSIADNIAGVIASPYQSIKEISAPIIAQNLHDGDLENVEKIYKSSSIAMLIAGVGMLITVYICLDALFFMSSETQILAQGKSIVLLLGTAKVIDMAAGINNHIISFSSLYRWNIILILILGILNIGFNYILIPRLGINGAALATLLSMTIYNVAKLIFVWVRFKLLPFTFRHIWVLVIALISYLAGFIIPDSGLGFLNLVLKGGVTAGVFGSIVLYFNFSPEITEMVQKLKGQFFRFLNEK